MHRSLEIPEIVGLIFAELRASYPEGREIRLAALAALARTCRSFQDPALNLLWSEQDTLMNLLRCLPSHLWEETIGQHPGFSRKKFRIVSTISPADWEIPLTYALRIRTLELTTTYNFPTVAEFETLSSGLPREYLCPNLRSISGVNHNLLPYIHLFLGPQIIAVTLTGRTSIMLSTLPIRYPALRRLDIGEATRGTGSSRSIRMASDIVMRLDRIEDLSIDAVDGMALEHLSQLLRLRSLKLYTPDVQDLRPFHLSPGLTRQCHSFPALREVIFVHTSIEFATLFLDLVSGCALESFQVGNAALTVKHSTAQMYAALASQLSHTALRSLRVELPDYTKMPATPLGTIADYVVTGRCLAPLFRFANLTKLNLETPVGFDIDDPTAWDMALAWPKLMELSLRSAQEPWALHLHQPPTITLDGVRAFATHCKELISLCITFDTSKVPPFDTSPSRRICQTTLIHLDVGTSPLHFPDTRPVARLLSGLFPNLRSLRTQDDDQFWGRLDESDFDNLEPVAHTAYAYHTSWKEVRDLVPMIAAVRREEEQYWAEAYSE